MDDPLNLSMFRAYDIRTPAADLTPELAERLAWAEAMYFRQVLGVSAVLVGSDARLSGARFLTWAADIFRRAGLDVVYLPGPCTASYFYFTAMRHPKCAAVMFGASHHPADDTGQKILGPGVEPIAQRIGPDGGIDKIKELYLRGVSRESERRGRMRAYHGMEDYIRHSMSLAGVAPDSLRGLRLLQDYLFGAAGPEMMVAFDRAGADLAPLHFTPDGAFPLGPPAPAKQKVIATGLEALQGGHFHLAMFCDGDGDRMDFYHGDGTYVSSSFVYAAILPEIRRRVPASATSVFADLKTNPLAVVEMTRAGVTVDVIRNGHAQIKRCLIDDPTRIGAVEESAHFYEAFTGEDGRRYCTENTLYIALLAARVWREQPDRIADLLRLQQTTARKREWAYKFSSDQQRTEALQAVREHFEAHGARCIQRMKSGMDLEGTLIRRGLAFDVDQHTPLAADWLQVCQRITQNDKCQARWDVVGANAELVKQAKRDIAECLRRFGVGEECAV